MLIICILFFRIASLEICGYEYCPVIHLRFKEPGDSRESDQQILDTVASDCRFGSCHSKIFEIIPTPRYSTICL